MMLQSAFLVPSHSCWCLLAAWVECLVKAITVELPSGSVRESLGGPEDRKGSTECKQYFANSFVLIHFFPPNVHEMMKSSDHEQSV